MVDHLQRVLDSFTEEIVVIDRDLRITYANPAWIHRLDLDPAQIFGHFCHQVLLSADTPCTPEECAAQQVFRTGQPVQLSHQRCRPGTSVHGTPLSASPIFDPDGIVVTAVEILCPSVPQPGRSPLTADETARLLEAERRQSAQLSLIGDISQHILSILDPKALLDYAVRAIHNQLGYDHVDVFLIDPEGEHFLLEASTHLAVASQRQGQGLRFRIGQVGILGHVVATGQSYLSNDVLQDPHYVRDELLPNTRSELAVPIRARSQFIGVLDLNSDQPNAFDENDLFVAQRLVDQLAIGLENARLLAQARHGVQELTSLMRVSQALNEAKDLDMILSIVLDQAFSLVGSKEGSIILIDPPNSNRLRIVAERGLGPEVAEAFNNRPVHTYEGTYKRALSSDRIEVADTSSDPDFLHDVGSSAKRVTNIPLMTQRGPIGLIAVDGLPRDETIRHLLTILAGIAAAAIDKERLHHETTARLAEVSTLYTLATQITRSLSLTSVLNSIVSILRMTLDCRACSIFLIDSRGEYLQLEAASGPSVAWKGIARLRIGEGISGRAIAEQRSIYIPDTHLEPDFIFFDPQIRSLVVVPLVVRNRAIGTLSIDATQPNAFDEEVRLLAIAAAQAAVAIENAELYESLQASYRELEHAFDELRRLDEMKSELIQNVSHELRTPLTFIKGYVELLHEGQMGDLLDEQKAAIDIVADKTEVLSRLVDDIIAMLQADREQIHRAPISLADIGHAAIQAAQASATEAGLDLIDEIPDGLPLILGDSRRLGQVFDNLLQNAIKFSDPGGTITVRLRDEGTRLRAEVQDTGIGIPADQLPRIFDRFYQVDGSTTRRHGGTGLGLAIVKQIVETHGGKVGVESEPNHGSLFFFTIPIALTGLG